MEFNRSLNKKEILNIDNIEYVLTIYYLDTTKSFLNDNKTKHIPNFIDKLSKFTLWFYYTMKGYKQNTISERELLTSVNKDSWLFGNIGDHNRETCHSLTLNWKIKY